MNERAWKPGDVAKLWINDVEHVVLRTENPHGGWVVSGEVFLADREHFKPRPLAVIDGEDREQVERLRKAMIDAHGGTFAEDIRIALREFVSPTPPKPAEPTGLGAVVEDADGGRWVYSDSVTGDGHPWVSDGLSDRWASWGDIAAVRVLSEGVTA